VKVGRMIVAVGACALVGLVAGSADAGPPGKWTQISHFPSRVGLARAKDGTLHVLWAGPAKLPYSAIYDTPVSPSGAVGPAKPVLNGWKAVNPPTAATAPDGSIHVVVSGAQADTPQDTTVGLNELVGPGSWQLGPHAFGCCNASNADVHAAVLKNGQLATAYVSAGGLRFQVGTDPGTQPQDVAPLGTASNPSIVVDPASGDAVVAYHGCGKDPSGHGFDCWRRMAPAAGAALQIGTGNVDIPMIAARSTGGVYGAVINIPNWTKVSLVRFGGAAKPVPVPQGAQAFWAGIATGPEGRLWVYYTDKRHIYVTRTSKSVSAFEPVQTLTPPAGVDIAVLEGEGSAGPLDLIAELAYHDAKDGAWHTQVQPALSVVAAKKQTKSGVQVTVRVTDAGDPVAGAKVTGLPGGPRTTDAKGQVAVAAKPGRLSLTATRQGYVPARLAVSL
jgi:hypothetical protein